MSLTIDTINAFADEVYRNACEKGFHDSDAERSDVENYAIWTANLTGEVSELWEAARKGQLFDSCDKSHDMITLFQDSLTCEEEELADILIRVLDTATARGINIGRAIILKHNYNRTRSHRHGGKLA